MTNMLDDKFDPLRRHDEPSSNQNQPVDKFGGRSRSAKGTPWLFGPADPTRIAATRADPEPPAPELVATRHRRLGLSLTQILGSTGAAVTAAFLGSRLGVAGTLIGAALASVISVVGGAIYTSSIKATKLRVAQAMVAVRATNGVDGAPDTSPLPVVPPVWRPRPPVVPSRSSVQVGIPRPPEPNAVRAVNTAGVDRLSPGRRGRSVLHGALIGALVSAAVFAAALAVVTGYESVSGTALSGGQAGSLTVLGGPAIGDGGARAAATPPSHPEKVAGGTARVTTRAPASTTPTKSGTAPATHPATTASPTTRGSTAVGPPPGTSGAPTTSAPTTSAPTTSAPTTAAPTTAAPTTAAPTTAAPNPTTSGAPTTSAPSTSVSVSDSGSPAASLPDNGNVPR